MAKIVGHMGETETRHLGNVSWKAAALETATDLGN
jgi:hypothetical protein